MCPSGSDNKLLNASIFSKTKTSFSVKLLDMFCYVGSYFSFTEQTAGEVQASFEICKCEQLEEVKNVPRASPSGGM